MSQTGLLVASAPGFNRSLVEDMFDKCSVGEQLAPGGEISVLTRGASSGCQRQGVILGEENLLLCEEGGARSLHPTHSEESYRDNKDVSFAKNRVI